MKLKYFIGLTFISLFIMPIFGYSAGSIKLPLTYHPQYGIYSTEISIAPGQQKLDVVIDTTSPFLIIVGDPEICSTCQQLLTKSKYNAQHISSIPEFQSIQYLSSELRVIPHKNTVALNEKVKVEFPFNVVISGIHTNNILGLSQTVDKNSSHSLWHSIASKYGLNKKMTFVLCGSKAKSYMILGDLPADFPAIKSSLSLDRSIYYSVSLKSIRDNATKTVMTSELKSPNNQAVFDTGTGGLIVLHKDIYEQVIDHMKDYALAQGLVMPPNFWHGSVCVPKDKVHYSKLPTLDLELVNNQKQTINLSLKPERYINGVGCGKDQVHLAIVQYHEGLSPTNMASKPQKEPGIILGTPFFEQYGVMIEPAPKNQVSFFPTDKICQGKTAAIKIKMPSVKASSSS